MVIKCEIILSLERDKIGYFYVASDLYTVDAHPVVGTACL